MLSTPAGSAGSSHDTVSRICQKVKRPVVPTVVVQIPDSTVSDVADTVVALKLLVSPVNDAVSDRAPSVAGVHEHVARPDTTALVAHPEIATPFSINATVPVVPSAFDTVATNV
jgi:hypothetical protein